MANVLDNVCSRSRKKFRHLRLREPNGFIFYPDFNVKFPALRLIHDNLILVGNRQNLLLIHFFLVFYKKKTASI